MEKAAVMRKSYYTYKLRHFRALETLFRDYAKPKLHGTYCQRLPAIFERFAPHRMAYLRELTGEGFPHELLLHIEAKSDLLKRPHSAFSGIWRGYDYGLINGRRALVQSADYVVRSDQINIWGADRFFGFIR